MWQLMVYMFLLAVTPGPNTILSFANASQKGIPRCFTLNFGMSTGVLVVNTISFFFLSFFSRLLPGIRPFIQGFGIVYLLFLGVMMLKKKSIDADGRKTGGFVFGFLLQIVNVKMIMLCVTAISLYILPMNLSPALGYVYSLSVPFVCFVCQILWSILGSVMMGVYKKHGSELNVFFAVMLFVLAGYNLFNWLEQGGVL